MNVRSSIFERSNKWGYLKNVRSSIFERSNKWGYLNKLTYDPKWTKHKLNLCRQHQYDWQLCFVLEDKTWNSLKQKQFREKQKSQDGPVDLLKLKQLIQQQLQDIEAWRKTMANYRHTLKVRQEGERLDLDKEKRALSTYFKS